MRDTSRDPVPRSLFVTIIGWLGVSFGTMGVLICMLQLVMLAVILPDFAALTNDPQMAQMPPLMRWMFEHFRLFIAMNLTVFVVILVASIGLLRRRNWARLTVVGLLVAGILANFAGLALQHVAMEQMAAIPGATAPPDLEVYTAMSTFMLGFGMFFVAIIALVHGWIAWKLLSAPIRREFGA
jgi:hypothetical protein